MARIRERAAKAAKRDAAATEALSTKRSVKNMLGKLDKRQKRTQRRTQLVEKLESAVQRQRDAEAAVRKVRSGPIATLRDDVAAALPTADADADADAAEHDGIDDIFGTATSGVVPRGQHAGSSSKKPSSSSKRKQSAAVAAVANVGAVAETRVTSRKGRQAASVKEAAQFRNILQHRAFSRDPFGALQQHLENAFAHHASL